MKPIFARRMPVSQKIWMMLDACPGFVTDRYLMAGSGARSLWQVLNAMKGLRRDHGLTIIHQNLGYRGLGSAFRLVREGEARE